MNYLVGQFYGQNPGDLGSLEKEKICPSSYAVLAQTKRILFLEERKSEKKYSVLLEIRSTGKPEGRLQFKAWFVYVLVFCSLNQYTFILSQFLKFKILGQA